LKDDYVDIIGKKREEGRTVVLYYKERERRLPAAAGEYIFLLNTHQIFFILFIEPQHIQSFLQ